jgi:two-component system, cell cycle response regulator DivK
MKKILVVEDNPANRELLTEMLSAWGYEVVQAVDGADGLAKVESEQPDLVLLDIQMPVLDGYAVVMKLRNNPRFKSLHVIALTAFAMRGDREKALSKGFDGYVTKPIEGAVLRTEMNRLLG